MAEVTETSSAASEPYLRALHELRCFIGDPARSIETALELDPDFAMAHVFKAYLFGLSTEKAAAPVTWAAAQAAARLARSETERAHAAAATELALGRWHAAGDLLGALSREQPLDALALQAGHQIDFFTGNAAMLRERMARAMPSWSPSMPGYHAVLGMHAFGLEECGDYAGAEALGRTAVELEPRDGWAQHAVAHVMEMQARQRDGIAWMRGNEAAWTGDSFLQIHNWWHLALFHYELGEPDEALALLDGPIAGTGSTYVLNLDDASALLWRLWIGGVEVGDRWAALAARWTPKAGDGCSAFNDMHAMMAFVGAGLDGAADALLAAQGDAMRRADDNAAATRDVGQPVCRALRAFGTRRYGEAVALLRPILPIAHRFGGSHAQRDVIELTLIEAALRAGDHALAIDLVARRRARRPDSPLSALFVNRAAAIGQGGSCLS